MQKIMPLAQFTVNLEWCASEAHTGGELLLRGHGANRVKIYSNPSQTRGSKLAKFSNSRLLSLFYTSKLAVPLLSTQIRDFCYFLSPKIREFGGITVYSFYMKTCFKVNLMIV